MLIGTYEERESALLGAKLLALSLQKYCPDLRLVIFIPDFRLEEFADFLTWSKSQSNIEVRPISCGSSWMSYNGKPFVLKTLLQESDVACWIDTDIILNGDFRELLQDVSKDTVVAAEESSRLKNQSGLARTIGWGLQPGRLIEGVICSGFVQVSRGHLELLDAWQKMLDDPTYIEAQKSPNPPPHLWGDQDLLTALLCSKAFEHLPVKLFRRGFDIVQDIPGKGYSVQERVINVLRRREPPLIHAQGDCKPWLSQDQNHSTLKENMMALLLRTNVELSPYFSEARKYRGLLAEPASCLEFKSPLARFFRFIALGNSALQGLPLAVIYAGLSEVMRILGKGNPQVQVEGLKRVSING